MSSPPAPFAASPHGHSPEAPHALKRQLRLRDLVLAQILTVVGSSWVGLAAGLGQAQLVAWLIAFALFYTPMAVAVYYLNREMPLEGGLYVWARRAFGDTAGFMTAWNVWAYGLVVIALLLTQMPSEMAYFLGPHFASLPENKPVVAAMLTAYLLLLAWTARRATPHIQLGVGFQQSLGAGIFGGDGFCCKGCPASAPRGWNWVGRRWSATCAPARRCAYTPGMWVRFRQAWPLGSRAFRAFATCSLAATAFFSQRSPAPAVSGCKPCHWRIWPMRWRRISPGRAVNPAFPAGSEPPPCWGAWSAVCWTGTVKYSPDSGRGVVLWAT